ncbi:cysteine-rich small domain-containing protein [Clostridium psychrophilum]|uniref:cysteine-rich small domain-containing protein n=1 Tax=Clostridium psychrophilum TaxID=132926 RepID=UPI001C0E1300|nr:cysteine-rich small domain-containing protein [Clostridium psychrophilum]MBU3182499.1 cysteine-rich small domain-containing protein [Clostridium psychrophilum]
MSNNYKFFRNNECEYFPCHVVKNDEKFNCLFCYCPLYFLTQCGGNGKFVDGVKDCSACIIPHCENGYDYIVNKIKEVNKTNRK